MPTVIESLVIELGLDPSKFTKAEKEAMAAHKKYVDELLRGGKEIEHEGKRVGDVFEKLKSEALGLVTVFLGGNGIKEFVGYVTSLDAATGRAAYTLNMGTKELSVWEGAGAQVGAQAGSITSAMQGLSGAVNQFALTGQGTFLPVLTHLGISLYDQNNRMKTASQMFLEIADAVQKLNQSDPARAAATLAMIPGMNQDSINLMIRGRSAIEGLLQSSNQAGSATAESAAAAAEYQKQLALLDRSATSLGRTFVTILAPALTSVMQIWQQTLTNGGPKSLFKIAPNSGLDVFLKWARSGYDTPFSALVEGLKNSDMTEAGRAKNELAKKLNETPGSSAPGGAPATTASLAEQEAYIRQAAIKRGIDPDVAVAVAKSEGLNRAVVGNNQQSSVIRRDGSREESYGAFQLYMGGGLGNKFQTKTGKDPRDPTTWKEQADFALDEAVNGGWGPWHGWKGLPRAGLPAPGGAPTAARNANPGRMSDAGSGASNTTVSIAKVEINTQATDAQGIANEIPDAMRRANWAASANYGQTG